MEDETPLSQQLLWLGLWLSNNIAVTLLNKASFSKVDFNYPFVLSAAHMLCNWIGTYVYIALSPDAPIRKKLDAKGHRTIFLFSFVFSANIAIGNVSLQYVSVAFNQVMRALVAAVVMLIGWMFFGKSHSFQRKLSILPVVVGVAMACFGEMSFTSLGFFFTVLCVLLAALKVVLSGEMLTGDIKLHPMDLLGRMAPLAFFEIFTIALLKGEVMEVARNWEAITHSGAFVVVVTGAVLSFTLNVCSLQANRLTSPLTLTICANVKQVLLIALGALVFATPVSGLNALGIAVVVLGSMRYSQVSFQEQHVLSGRGGGGGSPIPTHLPPPQGPSSSSS